MDYDRPKVIWIATDPTEGKRPVSMTLEGKTHIVKHHSELEPYIEALSTIVEGPRMILADAYDFDTDLYCAKGYDLGDFGDVWLRIVVRFDISNSGEVTTAYLSPDVPKGKIKWLPPIIKT